MWKVHLPASSYLAKQTPFFGTNHFLKALNPILLKSAGLTFFGRGMHEPHGWAPSDAGINDDPNEPDHPPWNHDPKTGELLDGGLHPIDFILRDLQQRFGYTPEEAQGKVQQAIDKYNQAHGEDSNHTLPNVDSPQWRKVVVGPYYDNSEETHMRRVRGDKPAYEGGPRPFVTYAYNRGNVSGGATGRWIDSGMIHMNKELGQVLQADGKDTKGLNYVSYNRLLPGSLSGGVVQSISTGDWKRFQSSGQLPDHYLSPEMQQSMQEQRMHPEVHMHQLLELMPDHAFRRMGAGKGLNTERLQAELDAIGVDHGLTSEQLKDASKSAALRLLFQPESQNIDNESAAGVGKVFREVFSSVDSHPSQEGYRLHAQHAKGAKSDEKTAFAKKSRRHAEKMVARLSHAASKLMDEGMSQEDALGTVLSQLREHDGGSKVEPEYRDMVQGVIDKLLGITGHEKFSFGDIPTDEETHGLSIPGIEMGHHEAPEHWHGNIIMGEHELAPVGNSKREEEMPPPPAPAPAPAPAPVSAPTVRVDPPQRLITDPRNYVRPAAPAPAPVASPAPRVIPPPQMRAATPLEQAFQQMMGQPEQQTFFDIGSGALVRRSHDINVGMDAIRKKIGYFDGFLRGER